MTYEQPAITCTMDLAGELEPGYFSTVTCVDGCD